MVDEEQGMLEGTKEDVKSGINTAKRIKNTADRINDFKNNSSAAKENHEQADGSEGEAAPTDESNTKRKQSNERKSKDAEGAGQNKALHEGVAPKGEKTLNKQNAAQASGNAGQKPGFANKQPNINAQSAKNSLNSVKNAAETANHAKNAAEGAKAAKDTAKAVAAAASGNVAGAAASLAKSAPQILKWIALIMAVVILGTCAISATVWGDVTDFLDAGGDVSDYTGADIASAQGLTDELLSEVKMCVDKANKRAKQIKNAIESKKSVINNNCKNAFLNMSIQDSKTNTGAKTYAAKYSDLQGKKVSKTITNSDGDQKTLTKVAYDVEWKGTTLDIQFDNVMTYYQAMKIIAAYNTATNGFTSSVLEEDSPLTIKGTTGKTTDTEDTVGSLADWLGQSGGSNTIHFTVAEADCSVGAWKGSYMPQYLLEQMVQDYKNGTYKESNYASKKCSLLDLLMTVVGPSDLTSNITIDEPTVEELTEKYIDKKAYSDPDKTITTTTTVNHYYKWVRNQYGPTGEKIEVGEGEKYDFGTTETITTTTTQKGAYHAAVEKTSSYKKYTYSATAHITVNIGMSDLSQIAEITGFTTGALN